MKLSNTTISAAFNFREISLGLIVFVSLLLIFPFIVILMASFGPSEWMHTYIAPFLEYRYLLILLSGVFVGLLSSNSPLLNSIVVGFLGAIIQVVFYFGMSVINDHNILPSNIYWLILKYVMLCAVGGSCVLVLRRIRLGSNKSLNQTGANNAPPG